MSDGAFMNKRILKVVEMCDIILEVVDARDIDGTRSKALENIVKEKGKHLIIVINKCDLAKPKKIPKNAIPFSAKKRWGTKRLRSEIKRIMNRDCLDKVKVGVVGYANTGKSSVIIALGGKAKASSRAGFTRGEQWTRISKHILLLDSPGIIPREEGEKKLAVKGALDVTKIEDAEGVAIELLKRINKDTLVKTYGVEPYDNPEKQLMELAGKWMMFRKGAELDTDRAARKLIKDWQKGKLRII